MKVAVVLTGFCRYYESTYENLYVHILKKYDADIFISSWDVVQYRPEKWDTDNPFSNYDISVTSLDTNSVVDLYNQNGKLVSYNFEKWNDFKINRFSNLDLKQKSIFETNNRAKQHGSFWVERLRDQWFIVKKGWNLINDKKSYDLILKLRFDLLINEIELKPNQFTILNSDIIERVGVNYCDYFAYGNYNQMKKYMNMFDEIENISCMDNIDISNAEQMLKFYMESYDESIITNIDTTINYKLIKK